MNPFAKKNSSQPDFELFTIYDSKTAIYDKPMFAKNKNDLVREFINFYQNPDHKQSKLVLNAEDFSLFKIGSYDSSHGVISTQNIEHVANMIDLRSIAQPSPGIVPT